MKQNASIDASFWINACAANVVELAAHYFSLFITPTVAEEIRYPLTILGIKSRSPMLFDQWIAAGLLQIESVDTPVDWFQRGENSAIALALERGYWLLLDDANPYHRAKSAGLTVVGTSELIVLLFDHGLLSYEAAMQAINSTSASKSQKRAGLTAIELLVRRKGIT